MRTRFVVSYIQSELNMDVPPLELERGGSTCEPLAMWVCSEISPCRHTPRAYFIFVSAQKNNFD